MPLLKVVLAVAVLSVLACGWPAYQWADQSDLLKIKTVEVTGRMSTLTEQDVTAIADVFRGQGILRADIQGAAQRALANPWIRSVRIERRLPGTIRIAVVEREPAVRIDAGSGRYLADAHGTVIARADEEQPAHRRLPVVMLRSSELRPGQQIDAPELDEALALLEELGRRGGWRFGEVTVKAASLSSLTVVYEGCEVRLGPGGHAEKLRRLAEVVADVKRRNVAYEYIDLRSERQAAVMVRGAQGLGSGGKGQGRKTRL